MGGISSAIRSGAADDDVYSRARHDPGRFPDLPPPRETAGLPAQAWRAIVAAPVNSFVTASLLILIVWIASGFLQWAWFDADFVAENRLGCETDGACWAVIGERWRLFLYSFYPDEESWRLLLTALLLPLALAPLLFWELPARRLLLAFSAVYPLLAYWLIAGGLGLTPVPDSMWGGLLLTLIIGFTGILFSLPLGILLALGRASDLPVIRMLCTGFIELVRGVPLITLLFFASVMLPLFLPEDLSLSKLTRALIVISLFASAYMAEVIRGGLQAVGRGQAEAARALGLGYWQVTGFIVLPQALKVSIPGIVNTFIGLFKDTSLVFYAIGLLDLVGIGEQTLTNQDWLGRKFEVYAFVALVFWVFCYAMSRYSLWLEKRLAQSELR